MSGTSIERIPSGDADHSADHGADEHGAIEPAHHGAIVSYNPDAPSEEWGWHGHWGDFAPRGKAIFLWVGVAAMLLMAVFGNHVSHVEDYFLVIIAALMAAWIVRSTRQRKRERRLRP
ncbi:hypothetical protein ABIB25_000472 [Nakamurella sp. UYEF19]|uniref:DUF2631 domain-containing protein n=1 Tax=Nakamurella sp. UYEF19 TaxID=1756392 RepID=UPI0033990C0D